MPILHRLARSGAALIGLGSCLTAAQAQTHVSNTATLTYQMSDGAHSIASNTVGFDVPVTKRPTKLGFYLPPVGYQLSGMSCRTTPSPVFTPAPIDAATFAASTPTDAVDIYTDMLLVLDNQGGNHDPTKRETATIQVDVGAAQVDLTLLETAPDSGIFAGGIPATATGKYPDLEPCDVREGRGGGTIKLSFSEDQYSYASTISILIDPAGFVFDSQTAALVDGATVSLVDAAGQPAIVYGDDGKSRYPSTVISGQATRDASGRSYPAQTGRYRFPLAAPGTYFLKVVPPAGFTAPTIVDHGALATLKDPSGKAFILKDASYGGSLTLDDTGPFFADIPIDHAASDAVVLTKTASVREASPGDFVQYHLSAINHGSTATAAAHITDTLPTGLRYEKGSTRGVAEPTVAADGRTLDFTMPALGPNATADITYVVMIAPGAPTGEALNRARVVGGASSNEAMASVRLRALLFTDAMTIIGRVTEGDCGDPVDKRRGIPGVRLLLEDGTFVVSDRDGLYHFEGVRPGRHVVQIDTGSMPASHVPVACDSDTRQAGSAISRFVEGGGGLLKRVDFQLKPTGKTAAATDALPIAERDDGAAAGNRDWLVGQTAGIEWLFPSVDHNPRAPVVRVAIKHLPGQRIALSVNGAQVDPLSFDTTDTDEAHGLAVSKWTGIPLVPGDNRLTARVLDASGTVVQTLERTVHVSGAPRRADFDPAHSRLVADGLTRPLIAVRVTDKDGHPASAGTMVPFIVDAPYAAAQDVALEQRRRDGQDRSLATPATVSARVVGDDGIAFIALQPTTQAGAVHAVVTMTEDKQVRTSEVRAWLAAGQKDWVVVGFGAGTIGYDMLNAHSAALPPSERNKVVTDGQLAFYAKGRVKGSWLLTIAYDSKRTYDPSRGLLGTIDPDRYYTVYGDGTQQGYDAATRRKLYLRLERRQFYALFGDFETGFTETQLTRYDRTLNGVKAAYEGTRVRANGFAAHTDTLYQRDEIQGNGLSGPYRLTARGIVPNSDKMTVETRDRYRSELVLSTTTMTRHIDYDIDTDLGTIRFRAPILSRDPNGNPIFIVVDYEIEGGRSAKLAAAGRVAAKLAGGRIEVGASGIRDETVGTRTIAGIDLKAHVTRNTIVRAEAATGGIDGMGHDVAYLAEFDHHDARLDLLAYIRSQDAGFGVGQQNLVEAGTRKIGVDTRVKLTDLLTFTATLWNQQQLVGNGSRTAGEAKLDYRTPQGTIFVGGQIAMDDGLSSGSGNSRLLTLGGSKTLFDNALTLTGQTQFAPGGANDNVDFPIRHQITASWRVKPGIRLIGGYEIADGAQFTAHTAQMGFDVAPWRGAKLMSTLNEQAAGENGARTYAQYGMSQSLPLGRHWTVDATVDSTATISGHIDQAAQINAFQPVASGGFTAQDQTNGAFTAVTLGAAYRGAHWSWNGRIERRVADAEDRWGLTTNFLRALGEGKTLAASVKAYTLKDKAGVTGTYAAGDVALALRPLDSRWSVLERFELRHEQAGAGLTDSNLLGIAANTGSEQVTTRIINNLAINYRTGAEGAGHGLEATVYYGAKYVVGRFADDVYTGYIDVVGFDLRRDVGQHFDIGIQGSVEHAWTAGAVSFSGGPSAGVSPGRNVWISVGYNVAGYRDRDFAEDRYTRQGPYVTMRVKFDQRTIGGAGRSLFGGGR